MLSPRIKAILSHVATIASLVVVANDKLKVIPWAPPVWLSVGLGAAAVVAGAVLQFLPPPGAVLEASETAPNDQDEATAKAAGAAGSAASKGPFTK